MSVEGAHNPVAARALRKWMSVPSPDNCPRPSPKFLSSRAPAFASRRFRRSRLSNFCVGRPAAHRRVERRIARTIQTVTANASPSDVAVSKTATPSRCVSLRGFPSEATDLSVFGANAVSELDRIPCDRSPGTACILPGALLYVPFLTGPAPILPPATNLTGGVDIFDARTGTLRRRIFLPEPFAMLSTDTDGNTGVFSRLTKTASGSLPSLLRSLRVATRGRPARNRLATSSERTSCRWHKCYAPWQRLSKRHKSHSGRQKPCPSLSKT